MNYYDLGEPVTIDGSFSADATVQLEIRLPDGTKETILSPDITHVDIGIYRYIYTPVQSGRHFYRWDVSGAIVGVLEKSFMVKDSVFGVPV